MDDKERKKRSREAMKSKGICTVCGKEKVEDGKIICSSCHERQLTYAERRRVERKERAAKGICTTCGMRQAEPRRRTCSECFLKSKEHRTNKEKSGSVAKKPAKKKATKPKKEDGTLCWGCKNCWCSWRLDYTPVNGWEATPTKQVKVHNHDGESRVVTRYNVKSCPEFVDTQKKGGRDGRTVCSALASGR